jgi:hypothetical protein
VYSVVRSIYLGIGRNFAERKIIDNERDVFFLEKNEIADIILEKSTEISDLKNKIESEKRKYRENIGRNEG